MAGHSPEWNKAHPELMRKYQRDWYYRNIDKDRSKKYLQRYGIDLNEFNRMFQIQGGCCAICSIHASQTKRGFQVDHDHLTGKIRELLCWRCNNSLGIFKDNPDLLQKAMDYLSKHAEPKK